MYHERRKLPQESWKKLIDDVFSIWSRYVEAGAARDEVDLIAQLLKVLRAGGFSVAFVEKWEVRESSLWKWDTFYQDVTLHLIGKVDTYIPDVEDKKALSAGDMINKCKFCGSAHKRGLCKAFGKKCSICTSLRHCQHCSQLYIVSD